jgi:hypothetical protein
VNVRAFGNLNNKKEIKMKQKLATFVMMLGFVMSFNVFASDNSIYIDQSGDNSTIVVTQDGAGNVMRGIQGTGSSNATPANIYGDSNQVTVNQVGSGNILSFGIKTTIAAGASGNVFNYSVIGNNATAVINSNNNGLGVSASNSIDIQQTGNTSNANVNVLGSKNIITAVTSGGASNSFVSTINGDENTQTVSMTGGASNSSILTQTGTKGTITLTSVGASNYFNVDQSGGSSNGHSTIIDVNGSSNTIGITQSGTSADSIVNLKGVGSGNIFTINSNTR